MMSLAEKPEGAFENAETLAMEKLWLASMASFMVLVGQKKGERYLRLLVERMDREAAMASVLRLRGNERGERDRLATLLAAEKLRRHLPTLTASLPDA